MNLYLKVGDPVIVHSDEGIHGPGKIIDERPVSDCRWKIAMDDNSTLPGWYWDWEVYPTGSGLATVEHIRKVQHYLACCLQELRRRADVHDESKLGPEEKPAFDRETPLLKTLQYGTPEYAESLGRLGSALDHHYKVNTHHPQHYDEGIEGMDLFDAMEMVCDWKAAVERTESGDIFKSLEVNAERFNIGSQLLLILSNTIRRFPNLKF